jgi:hypothetical protein
MMTCLRAAGAALVSTAIFTALVWHWLFPLDPYPFASLLQ